MTGLDKTRITDPSLSTEQTLAILKGEYVFHKAVEDTYTEVVSAVQEVDEEKAKAEKQYSAKWPFTFVIVAVLFAIFIITIGFSIADTPTWHEGEAMPAGITVIDYFCLYFLLLFYSPAVDLYSAICGVPSPTEIDFTALFSFSCVLGLIPLVASLAFYFLRRKIWRGRLSDATAKKEKVMEQAQKKISELNLRGHFERMPKGYDYSAAIGELIAIIEAGRAYNWKDAVNLFQSELKQAKYLDQQKQLLNELQKAQELTQQAIKGWKEESKRPIYVYRS